MEFPDDSSDIGPRRRSTASLTAIAKGLVGNPYRQTLGKNPFDFVLVDKPPWYHMFRCDKGFLQNRSQKLAKFVEDSKKNTSPPRNVGRKVFQIFYEFLQSNQFPSNCIKAFNITEFTELIQLVMQFCDKEEISSVYDKLITLHSVSKLEIVATVLNLPELGIQTSDMIYKNAEDLIKTEDFLELDSDSLVHILKSDYLCCDELHLFNAVVSWTKRAVLKPVKKRGRKLNTPPVPLTPWEQFQDIFKLIRFPLISSSDIADNSNNLQEILPDKEYLELFKYVCATNKSDYTTFSTTPRGKDARKEHQISESSTSLRTESDVDSDNGIEIIDGIKIEEIEVLDEDEELPAGTSHQDFNASRIGTVKMQQQLNGVSSWGHCVENFSRNDNENETSSDVPQSNTIFNNIFVNGGNEESNSVNQYQQNYSLKKRRVNKRRVNKTGFPNIKRKKKAPIMQPTTTERDSTSERKRGRPRRQQVDPPCALTTTLEHPSNNLSVEVVKCEDGDQTIEEIAVKKPSESIRGDVLNSSKSDRKSNDIARNFIPSPRPPATITQASPFHPFAETSSIIVPGVCPALLNIENPPKTLPFKNDYLCAGLQSNFFQLSDSDDEKRHKSEKKHEPVLPLPTEAQFHVRSDFLLPYDIWCFGVIDAEIKHAELNVRLNKKQELEK